MPRPVPIVIVQLSGDSRIVREDVTWSRDDLGYGLGQVDSQDTPAMLCGSRRVDESTHARVMIIQDWRGDDPLVGVNMAWPVFGPDARVIAVELCPRQLETSTSASPSDVGDSSPLISIRVAAPETVLDEIIVLTKLPIRPGLSRATAGTPSLIEVSGTFGSGRDAAREFYRTIWSVSELIEGRAFAGPMSMYLKAQWPVGDILAGRASLALPPVSNAVASSARVSLVALADER